MQCAKQMTETIEYYITKMILNKLPKSVYVYVLFSLNCDYGQN